jgi:hypothetical protein
MNKSDLERIEREANEQRITGYHDVLALIAEIRSHHVTKTDIPVTGPGSHSADLAEMRAQASRADHWMAVALAFRDATTEAATDARDGERDPYLERAQDLFNATARDFGPVPAANRFFCDCCDTTVRVDEDGLCTMCGGDTWGVFDPVAHARETAIAAAYPPTPGHCMKPSKYSDVAPCYNPLPCNAHENSSSRKALAELTALGQCIEEHVWRGHPVFGAMERVIEAARHYVDPDYDAVADVFAEVESALAALDAAREGK